jgi:hypothetical protein
MLLKYDTHMFSSVGLLAMVKSQNVKARSLSENSKIAVFAKLICTLINKLQIMISEKSSSRTGS